MEENEFVLPEGDGIHDLAAEDLDAYENAALGEIDSLFEGDTVTRESVERGKFLEVEVGRVRTERTRRDAEAAQLKEERDGLVGRLRGEKTETAAVEEVVTAASQQVGGGAVTALRDFGGINGPKRSLNPELRGVKRSATTSIEDISLGRAQALAKVSDSPKRDMDVLVASADIPGFTQGGRLQNMAQVRQAMYAKARTLGVSHGNGQRVPVAQLQRKFLHTMGAQMNLDEMTQIIEMATNPEVLIAAGGWCSPHEISYDFYNVVCIDGLVDLPTLGINRGGLSWPISPSYGDISALPGVVWTWTETQDIAAVTGTAQSGVKPCVRVPCPDYTDATLDCDGMCVTVGNLTSDAFPELIENHLRLVEAIHAHYMNTRLIQQLVLPANSTPVTITGSDRAASWGLVNSAAQQRRDMIEKYAMCDDAVFEAIFPRFGKDMVKNDIAVRNNLDFSNGMCISDSDLASWFDCRNIRTQWVADWQVRTTGAPGASDANTAWPSAALQYLLYPAGTFARGQGMTLDLGVVRDSTLNETNDYTAAWMEECWLLAKIGHESRLVTADVCVNGAAGQAVSGCQI